MNEVGKWMKITFPLLWWLIWIILLVWIFVLPYRISGEKMKKDSPLDILRKRFASGEITKEEYQEKKEILEKDMAKKTE